MALITYIPYSARHGMPGKLVGWHSTVGCNLHSFFPAYILPHPFPGRFWRKNQWPAIVNVDQSFVSRRRHYQETLCFITTFERRATDRRHKYWLSVGAVNEVGLFLVAFRTTDRQSISPGRVVITI
jgi:hypothetical protein